MPSTSMLAALLLLSVPANEGQAHPILCSIEADHIAGGDDVTAIVCEGQTGFFVPSDVFRRPRGMAESLALRPVQDERIRILEGTLAVNLEAVRTSSRALGKANLAIVGLEDRLTETTGLLADRDAAVSWRIAACSVGGMLVGAAACIGVAHALPHGQGACP